MNRRRGWAMLALMFVAGMCRRTPTIPVTYPPCGDPRNISCDAVLSSTPSIDVSPEGRVYLVWTRGISTDFRTFRPVFREFDGLSWSPVESLFTGPVWATCVAAGPEGEVHVVWEAINYDQATSAVVYRMRDVRGRWHAPETLSVWSNPAKQACMDVDPTGRVHVIWGGRYRSRSPAGVWDVDESGVPVGLNPWMVVDSTGTIHVVWGSGLEIHYARRTPDGTWIQERVAVSPYSWTFISDQEIVMVHGTVFVSAVISSDSPGVWKWGLWKREPGGVWQEIPTGVVSRQLSSVHIQHYRNGIFSTRISWASTREPEPGWNHVVIAEWRIPGSGVRWLDTLEVLFVRNPYIFQPACNPPFCWAVWTAERDPGENYEVFVQKLNIQ